MTHKPYWMLPPILIFCIIVVWMTYWSNRNMVECNTWQKDMKACKAKECCVELRNKQPSLCYIPDKACSIYE